MLEFVKEPDAESLATLIASFANASGGMIIVGVDEAGALNPHAIEELEPTLERAFRLLEPPFRAIDLPEWRIEDTPSGQVATVSIRPTPYDILVAGTCFVRSGKLNIPLRSDQDRWQPQRRRLSFEDETVPGATLQDLDDEIIDEYQRNRIRRGPHGESFTRTELLRDAGAIDATGQLTAAGVLLFGRHPEYFFPQVGVVIVRFKGTSMREVIRASERYSRRIEIVGPAARVVEGTWQALFDELHGPSYLNGLEREECYQYPPEAVREAVVNAVCHRDYTITGKRIEIRLFDDRLEIISPGNLPGHITLDNILEEHYSRNPRLVRGLYYWGYIEELGQGIDIIYEAMQRNHHPPPKFEELSRSFRVTLYNAIDELELHYGDRLNPRQIQAIRYLATHERITNREFRELCPDVSAETLRLDLRDLVAQGILLKVGDKRGTYYVLK